MILSHESREDVDVSSASLSRVLMILSHESREDVDVSSAFLSRVLMINVLRSMSAVALYMWLDV